MPFGICGNPRNTAVIKIPRYIDAGFFVCYTKQEKNGKRRDFYETKKVLCTLSFSVKNNYLSKKAEIVQGQDWHTKFVQSENIMMQ